LQSRDQHAARPADANVVATHVKHICAELDVYSKQELLDLFQ